MSIEEFEKKLDNNLYRIWNRMSSGSYMPPSVKRVMIPKADGKHIKGFFDNIDHPLMMHAVRKHTDCPWMLLYIERWRQCKLEAHPDKTRIVYCRDSNRTQDHEPIKFDFLGYTFRPRSAQNREGEFFCSFLPAISAKAAKAILAEVRNWDIHRMSDRELTDLKRMFNAKIRGWIAYYGRYYPSALHRIFRRINRRLVRWAQQKYKRFARHQGQTWQWLRRLARSQPDLFAHWKLGMAP